jgi:hypothetical protein
MDSPTLPRGEAVSKHTATGRPARWLRTGLCLLALGTGLWYLASGLFAIRTIGWRQPIFDQLRLYPIYLGLPFPDNVLQLENGHRPIIPALLRVAELRWFGGDQSLQVLVGALLAATAVAVVGFAALRSSQLGAARRVAGAAMFAIAVFWLANARMLLHGNESVHAYLVVLMAVVAITLVWRSAGREHGAASLLLAMACGVVATLSFGPGVAVPVLVIWLALLAGVGWRRLLVVTIVGFALLFAYIHWLPGAEGVRDSITVRALDNLRVMAVWMNAPWMSLGLGALAPEFAAEQAHAVQGTWVARPWSLLARHLGPEVSFGLLLLICAALALLALLVTVRSSMHLAGPRRSLVSPLFAMGVGLAWFGFGVAALISLSRLAYFDVHPGQVLADRYLMWPCLLWAGMFLQWVASPDAPGDGRRGATACLLVIVIGLAAWPAHRQGAAWGAAVFAIAERSAVAAWMGIEDPEWSVDDGAASLADKRRAVESFRQRRIAMFSRDTDRWVGRRVEPSPADHAEPLVQCTIIRTFVDANSGSTFRQFRGLVPHASMQDLAGAELVVVDAARTVVGLATWTHSPESNPASPRFGPVRRSGFDGYAPATATNATVLAVRPGGTRAVCTIAGNRGVTPY